MRSARHAAHPHAAQRRGVTDRLPRTRVVLAASCVLVICVTPFASARTGDTLREGVRNGTTTAETQIISNLRTTTRPTGGYSMRMSNLSSTGGGFINGCRASAAPTSKPCYRSNNLSDGRAFEFNANDGAVVGTITAGDGGDTKKPLTTNATGIATGLNADRVDGMHAGAIIAAARAGLLAATAKAEDANMLDGIDSAGFVTKAELLWALVDADGGSGTIIRGRGVPPAGVVASPGIGRYVVTFSRDISNCGLQATLGDAVEGHASPGQISVDRPEGASVEVNTYDHTGTPAPPTASDGFHVQVTC